MTFKPPRVLHVISRLSYYGAENVVDALVRELHGQGYPVGVLAMYESPNASLAAPFPYYSIARRGRGDLGFFSRMLRAVRDFKPDIVHTHVHNGKYWGRLAALAAGVRTIVHTEHDSAFRAHPLAVLGNHLLHPRTRRIVTFTPSHRAALLRGEPVSKKQLVTIPNGIADARAAGDAPTIRALLGERCGSPIVAHVGRLRVVKNQRLALEAFALFARDFPHATLALIGEGEQRAMLETLRDELALGDRVHFLGFRPDARALLESADALLVTSTNEAMPLAVLEALMGGVPVATTPWPGAGDILAGGTLASISSDYSPHSVAQTLASLFTDANVPARTAAATRFAREYYGIARCAQLHRELYESLCPSTGSG